MKKIIILMFLIICSFAYTRSNNEKINNDDILKIIDEILDENKIDKNKEMRGVWVASVLNIDWPSKKGLTISQQKSEFIKILDNVKKWNMNAVFVQIKPVGDAFYPSEISPWSEYLTGVQGKDPGYDPLKFMIEESHKRGIEFHAWFNPYRLTMSGGLEKLVDGHIAKQHPDWTVYYGGKLYLNPGIPEVNEYVVESIMEVVRKYDIDGVHMDDYFYPYKVANETYNDTLTYRQYGKGFNNIDDWRRNNINELIKKLNVEIKKQKSNVSFGISPFGVWRNSSTDPLRGSNTKASIQNYDDLYADILKWMENKWIDYVAPQIYWNQGFSVAEYNTLVLWWSNYSNIYDIPLYIGQAVYKVPNWDKNDEIINQINFNRKFKEVKGSIYFSYNHLEKNHKNIIEQLLNGPYKD